MTKTILANAQIVLPSEVIQGAIHLEAGRITAIEEGSLIPQGAIDCQGDLVMPGLIELHTDNIERHLQPRPKVGWPHLPAILAHDAELASAGITTVFDALRVGSVRGSKSNYGEYARALASEILDLRAKGLLRINHLLHLRAEVCSESLVEEMAKFGPEDHIGIVSLMDHTPGERQFRDIDKLREYMVGKHRIFEGAFLEHVAAQKALRAKYGELHEKTAVLEARRYGAVLASHDDTTAEQVSASFDKGVLFAEFPTTIEAARACCEVGTLVMMGAPNLIRGGSHSGNVAAKELAKLDLLDILSSDYVPSSLLSAALMLGDLWGDIARAVATVTLAPALATGLKDRGRLEVGLRADVIRVTRIKDAGAVRGVWVNGERVG